MIFINTRPHDRAQALSQCLRQAHYQVIDLPILELRAKPFDIHLNDLFQQLVQSQVIVVVSPTAVEVGMRYLAESQVGLHTLASIQWIAVGKTTADALAKYGVVSHIPEVETSEGILSLPIFHEMLDLQQIAFWRGEGGRQFLMQQCQNREIHVLNFVLYERYCPQSSIERIPEVMTQLEQSVIPYFVCISSEASWNNWLHMFLKYPKIVSACHYLVLGQRLLQVLNADKNKLQLQFEVTCLNQLKPEVVLRTIEHLERQT